MSRLNEDERESVRRVLSSKEGRLLAGFLQRVLQETGPSDTNLLREHQGRRILAAQLLNCIKVQTPEAEAATKR